MSIRLYNTMTRRKDEFKPLGTTALIYGCGPTVYNMFHIGNARAFVIFDVLRRYLEYRGINVKYVQNFTDIDDKIIDRANREKKLPSEIAQHYIEEYFKDADGLNIRRADVYPRATENISGMIELIQKLLSKGHAYVADGDVFFRTRSFSGYGKLSRQSIDDLESGARIVVDDRKEDPFDFVLWKAAKPGEPSWPSPWGEGRPGWHIECSVMAATYLGKTIDIHCGGQDLVFPHHENEIAQSEAANGCVFARFWLHNGYINADNKKMSKSLGNFFMTREAAALYGYEAIRFFIVSAHYRNPINYTAEVMESARASLERIKTCRGNIDFLLESIPHDNNSDDSSQIAELGGFRENFIKAMNDDLNTADAISVIFDLIRKINTQTAQGCHPSEKFLKKAGSLLDELCGVLGIKTRTQNPGEDAEIMTLVEKRNAARKLRDFKTADEIRDKLKDMGITLEDTPSGVKIVRR